MATALDVHFGPRARVSAVKDTTANIGKSTSLTIDMHSFGRQGRRTIERNKVEDAVACGLSDLDQKGTT